MAAINMVGEKFGRLLVVSRAGSKPKGNSKSAVATWNCLCDCGGNKVVAGDQLRKGNTKSCGCLAAETQKVNVTKYALAASVKSNGGKSKRFDGVSAVLSAAYGAYERSAPLRGYEFSLSIDKFVSLSHSNCHYCGAEPVEKETKKAKCIRKQGRTSAVYTDRMNGIDRIDNVKGYIAENCVPCCFICNRAKNSMPYSEFVEWADRLARFRLGNS